MGSATDELGLAPGLLVSMPQLADPNFSRAVVLMIEHNDEGSFGLIINQESDITVEDLLSTLEIDWQGGDDVVWSGGPVMPTTGWVLHSPDTSVSHEPDLQTGLESGTPIHVCKDIALSTSPQALAELAAAPPDRLRFLLGYAGWGPGQLAEEMARSSWLHADADATLVFDTAADEMWNAALHSIGVNPESVVPSRGIH